MSQYSNLVVVVVRATEAATATTEEAYFWSTTHIQKQTLLSIQVEKEERNREKGERERGKERKKNPERRKDDEGKEKRNSSYRNRNIKERANPKRCRTSLRQEEKERIEWLRLKHTNAP